jgi:hypothetical protein
MARAVPKSKPCSLTLFDRHVLKLPVMTTMTTMKTMRTMKMTMLQAEDVPVRLQSPLLQPVPLILLRCVQLLQALAPGRHLVSLMPEVLQLSQGRAQELRLVSLISEVSCRRTDLVPAPRLDNLTPEASQLKLELVPGERLLHRPRALLL